jgi:hypothetical protein
MIQTNLVNSNAVHRLKSYILTNILPFGAEVKNGGAILQLPLMSSWQGS